MAVRWLFLLPLVTGVLSGYVSYYLMDEISYFTGAFSLICLLIGLFIAPWEFQLFILVLVLIAVRLLWIKVNLPKEESYELQEEDDASSHHRTYRGIAYPSQEVKEQTGNEQAKKGTYRGIPWENRQEALEIESQSRRSHFVRKYRGVPLSDDHSENSEQ